MGRPSKTWGPTHQPLHVQRDGIESLVEIFPNKAKYIKAKEYQVYKRVPVPITKVLMRAVIIPSNMTLCSPHRNDLIPNGITGPGFHVFN
jgi:hypothetical protein